MVIIYEFKMMFVTQHQKKENKIKEILTPLYLRNIKFSNELMYLVFILECYFVVKSTVNINSRVQNINKIIAIKQVFVFAQTKMS